MCDLPADLVREKILTRVPITSVRAVRSTCKLWNALTKDLILGNAAATRQQFVGFMLKNSKVCSVRYHLYRSKDKEDEGLLDLSVKQVDLLNQVKISQVSHCEGLLLCVAEDRSRLVVWNPYLGQTKWIRPNSDFHILDSYALGYDINCNHKILRFSDFRYEIYEFSSSSWRVLKLPLHWEIKHQGGVSVKGNTYFFGNVMTRNIEPDKYFLLCFDFTTEGFGRGLPLPFHPFVVDTVVFSCVREEKLAVLYAKDGRYINSCNNPCNIVEIWITTTIEVNHVSWSKFLRVDMRPIALTGIWSNKDGGGSFFIDEEEKVVVVFNVDDPPTLTETVRYNTAFIIGEDGYFKSVSLGKAPKAIKHWVNTLVCSSSYRPSLVQLNQPQGDQ